MPSARKMEKLLATKALEEMDVQERFQAQCYLGSRVGFEQPPEARVCCFIPNAYSLKSVTFSNHGISCRKRSLHKREQTQVSESESDCSVALGECAGWIYSEAGIFVSKCKAVFCCIPIGVDFLLRCTRRANDAKANLYGLTQIQIEFAMLYLGCKLITVLHTWIIHGNEEQHLPILF